MYPAQFDYHTPGTVREALDLLGRHKDDAKLLAGGHSLLPAMKLRLAQPKHLVDLRKISGLSGIKEEGGTLVIGAMATHSRGRVLAGRQVQVPAARATWPRRSATPWCATWERSAAASRTPIPPPTTRRPSSRSGPRWSPRGRRASGRSRPTTSSRDFSPPPSRRTRSSPRSASPLVPARLGAAYVKFPHPASRFAVVGVAAVLTLDAGKVSKASIGITGAGTQGRPGQGRRGGDQRQGRRRGVHPGGGREGAGGRRRPGRSPGLRGLQEAPAQGLRQAGDGGGGGSGEVIAV